MATITERLGAVGVEEGDVDGHASLDLVTVGDETLQRLVEPIGLHRRQVAEVSEVDTEDGDAERADHGDRAQHRAVAAEADGKIQPVEHLDRRLGVDHLRAVAEGTQPTGGVDGEVPGVGPLRMRDEADAGHLTAAPVRGDGDQGVHVDPLGERGGGAGGAGAQPRQKLDVAVGALQRRDHGPHHGRSLCLHG